MLDLVDYGDREVLHGDMRASLFIDNECVASDAVRADPCPRREHSGWADVRTMGPEMVEAPIVLSLTGGGDGHDGFRKKARGRENCVPLRIGNLQRSGAADNDEALARGLRGLHDRGGQRDELWLMPVHGFQGRDHQVMVRNDFLEVSSRLDVADEHGH